MTDETAPAAIRWLGEENCAEVFALLGWDHPDDELDHSRIYGLGPGRDETARQGDWIVPDGQGWFQPVADQEWRDGEPVMRDQVTPRVSPA